MPKRYQWIAAIFVDRHPMPYWETGEFTAWGLIEARDRAVKMALQWADQSPPPFKPFGVCVCVVGMDGCDGDLFRDLHEAPMHYERGLGRQDCMICGFMIGAKGISLEVGGEPHA